MSIFRQIKLIVSLLMALMSPLTLAQKAISDTNTNVSHPNNLSAVAQQSLADAEAYREVLLEILDMLDQVSLFTGREDARVTVMQLHERIIQLDAARLQRVVEQAPPLSVLQERLMQSRNLLRVAVARDTTGNDTRTIDFPEPETTVAACSLVESTFAFILFSEWGVIREILAALRWVCLDEVAGLNSAESCTVENILNTAAELEYFAAEACLQEQRDAYLEAILETDENIADHLSEFVDATTSSRASQDSIDDVQSDVTTNQGLLDDVQSSLETDFSSIENDLNSVLDDLDTLAGDVTLLASVTDDIQFRAQENQVDIEDAQTRAADARETAEEIRTDTQSIITAVSVLQSSLDNMDNELSAVLAQTNKAALVAALANPDSRIIRFMLPQSAGGELETARELVIQAILAFADVGAKTTTAHVLLTQGDNAYNQQDYFVAYSFFAQSYQALLGATPNKPGVLR